MLDESVSERKYWKRPINISREQWMILLEDKETITEQDAQLLRLIYTSKDCKATAGQLAHILNMPHHAPLNRQVGQLGKRIVKTLNIQAPMQNSGKGFNWWEVPFWGEATREGYYWILRPELREAMREIDEEGAFLLEKSFPEEIDADSHKNLFEGTKTQIYVNSYERNRYARDRCVKYYGTICVICGFDFEKTYGEIGKNVIHVHHLKPLYEIRETYIVDPIKDLRPVCPNCHVIIHRNNPAYSIEEVMAMIKNTRIE
ncbi:MAG TPA: HNH endonuclease [Ktedonobacteraceae bacterium]|nr:HNH endonuclease [Ktedonobacteraceae bacterium]